MTRWLTLAWVTLARARLAANEPEQAAVDGEAAVALAESVTGPRWVRERLRELQAEAAQYDGVPAVRNFRVRLSNRV
jgi:hypothetical protein